MVDWNKKYIYIFRYMNYDLNKLHLYTYTYIFILKYKNYKDEYIKKK